MKKNLILPMAALVCGCTLALSGCGDSRRTAAADYIGIDAAKEAALTDAGVSAGQADFSSAGLDNRDGVFYYEVNFTENGTEYQYDIDAMTGASMGGLVFQCMAGFPPCTASACLELLRYYQVALKGKNVVIVGTGVTVGMPTAILLMNQGATVSACNIFTDPERLRELCQGADVIISAAGKAGLIGREHVRPGQVVVDVGVSPGQDGKLHGDVDFEAVEPIVAAITPVPGGVGAVTSTVLSAHTVEAALRSQGILEKLL